MIDRRQFTRASLAAAAAAVVPKRLFAASDDQLPYTFCAFTKFVQTLDHSALADAIADAGFDGVELTARRTGNSIHPERAPEELPQLQEALQQRGLTIAILTTDILRADDPLAEPMLRVAAQLGIDRYRLGFHRYDLSQPVLAQIERMQPIFRDLAAMSREIGITAVYQNHAGANYVGATLWDLHRLIADYPPSEIGCVFDIRHAVVEAGEAWPVYYNLMKPHLRAVSVKDFRWGTGHPSKGARSQHVPLGEGRVDRRFFAMLRESDFQGPVSVHVEYLPEGGVQENLAALRRDLQTVRDWLRS